MAEQILAPAWLLPGWKVRAEPGRPARRSAFPKVRHEHRWAMEIPQGKHNPLVQLSGERQRVSPLLKVPRGHNTVKALISPASKKLTDFPEPRMTQAWETLEAFGIFTSRQVTLSSSPCGPGEFLPGQRRASTFSELKKKKRKPLSLNRMLCSPRFSTKFMKVFQDNLSHALVKAPWSNHTIAHGSLQS